MGFDTYKCYIPVLYCTCMYVCTTYILHMHVVSSCGGLSKGCNYFVCSDTYGDPLQLINIVVMNLWWVVMERNGPGG